MANVFTKWSLLLNGPDGWDGGKAVEAWSLKRYVYISKVAS